MLTREQELELQRNTEIKENDSLRQQLAQARQEKLTMYEEAEEVAAESLARMQYLEQQLAQVTHRVDVAEPELTACRARANYYEQQLAAVTQERDELKRKYDLVRNDQDYVQCCELRRLADTQLATVTQERDELDKLTSMQSGSFTMLHDQLAQRDARVAELEAALKHIVEVDETKAGAREMLFQATRALARYKKGKL